MVPLNLSGKESGQMATGDVAVGAPGAGSSAALQTPTSKRIINDFSIQVATVNGSGSQSANLVLLKSIFGMGIPVSGKNLFPSNIAGLPTWYTIRASKQGYVARRREIELLVAMNAETAREDILSLPTGGAAIYDETLNLKQYRDDVICYPVPFDKLTAAVCPEAKLRKLVRNMVYVGRGGAVARHGSHSGREGRATPVCQKAEGCRPELDGGKGRIRLRCQVSDQAGSTDARAHARD